MEWPKIPASGALSRYILGALAIIAVLLYLRFAPDSMKPWTGKPGPVTIAEPAEEARWVEPEFVKGPEKVRTYGKVKLSGKLSMPELVSLPGNVIATADIPPHAGSTTAIATLSDNGVGTIIYRQEKVPFFQIKKEFRASARYLFTGVNQIEAEVIANPLRVGPVELEAGAGVEVRRFDSSLGLRSYISATYRF